LKESQNFDFKLPVEGSLISIENIAMSASTQNRENVYKFMNFLLSKKVSAKNSDAFGYNPSNRLAYDLINKEIYENKNIFPDDEMFKKLYFLHNDVPEKKLQDMWLAVKSS
jgi:spermidine/putrescine transport system substrate-binding protein